MICGRAKNRRDYSSELDRVEGILCMPTVCSMLDSPVQEVIALHNNANDSIDPRHGPDPPDEAKEPAQPRRLNCSSLRVPVELDLVVNGRQVSGVILGPKRIVPFPVVDLPEFGFGVMAMCIKPLEAS